MNPVVAEWVSKAEGDFATLERECRARRRPNHDAACFHAQQCAEKYLKARLVVADLPVPKIHNLTALLDRVLPVEPLWEVFRPTLAYLSVFAVAARYPGDSLERHDALEALRCCKSFRTAARSALRFANGNARRKPRRK